MEIRRHDARYQKRDPVQLDGAAGDFGIRCEPALPQAVAQNCHTRSIGLVFLWKEIAAELWLDTEQREEVGGDASSVETLGIACTAEVQRNGRQGGDAFD